MKKTGKIIALLCMMAMGVALTVAMLNRQVQSTEPRVYEYPACMATNSRIVSIEKVTMDDEATVVDFKVNFRPGWWVRMAKDTYLVDENGSKYMALRGENITLGENFTTPESGEGEFTIYFEPMPKSTRWFDLYEGHVAGAFRFWGVHDKRHPLKAEVPEEEFEMTDALRKEFLRSDSVRIKGRIDAELLGENAYMMIYNREPMTDERNPLTVPLAEDGSFDISYLIHHPKMELINYGSEGKMQLAYVYIIPGQTIELSLHGESRVEYLNSFEGPFALKRSLEEAIPASSYFEQAAELVMKQEIKSFKEYAALVDELLEKSLTAVEFLADKCGYTPWELHLERLKVRQQAFILIGDWGLDQILGADDEERKKIREAMKDHENYYVMRQLPLDDLSFLATDCAGGFLNHYEFCYPMLAGRPRVYIDGLSYVLSCDSAGSVCDKELFQSGENSIYYNMRLLRSFHNDFIEGNYPIGIMDSVYKERRAMLKDEVLLAQFARLYDLAKERQQRSRPLPDTPTAETIRKILNKYRGKYVFVDFWGMGCAPCKAQIQRSVEMRKELADNPDLELVFISAEGESSPSAYKEFVDEYLAGEEVYEVSRAEFNRLSELFKIDGIPHSETFDRNGNVMSEKLEVFHYEKAEHVERFELQRLIKEE